MISVIVPVYNIEKYLKKCLDSLAFQTCSDVEFILVDDGSTDNCGKICDDYAEKDKRFKVIHKKNGGLVSARKVGIKNANGEYIGFVDGDDYIEKDMYFEFEKMIKKYKPDILVSEFFFSYEDREEKSSQIPEKEFYSKSEFEKIYDKILFTGKYYEFGINPNCWSKVFKKELLEKNLYLVDDCTRMGEDAAFTYPCLLDANSVCYISKPLYHYRIADGSMTKSYDKNMVNIVYIAYDLIKKKVEQENINFASQLSYYLLYLSNFVIRNEAICKNKTTYKEKKKVFQLVLNKIKSSQFEVDYGVLPKHTKLLLLCIKSNSVFLLNLYCSLLKIFI